MAREIDPSIRAFRKQTWRPLKTLVHRTITTCYPGHYCPEAVRFFVNYHEEEAILRDAEAGCTIVLDKGGRLLGTGTLVGDEIKRVFVDPGVSEDRAWAGGSCSTWRRWARSQGAGTVKLDASLPSKAFYDRLGYVTIERTSLPVENGRRLDFFKMQKEPYHDDCLVPYRRCLRGAEVRGQSARRLPECTRALQRQMQKIAWEMNFSETTFIPSDAQRDGGYDVRIFTPAAEVPFAGHPTLGTAYIIRQEILRKPVEQVNLNLKVGQIPVRFDRQADGRDILWMTAEAGDIRRSIRRRRACAATDRGQGRHRR